MAIKFALQHLSRFKYATVICSLLFANVQAFAQLKLSPLKHKPVADSRLHSSARTKAKPPLTLPFFDDFSKPYFHKPNGETYPDSTLWARFFPVAVNSGLGINAPSINVASFNGLDSIGNPYNATEIFLSGFTDYLVSKPIDLSENAAVNAVSVAERNSVYLSFQYQWQGNGEAPDKDDYLQVQFLNAAGQWETGTTIKPSETILFDKFYQAIVKVDGDRFFTSKFQFRFRTFGRQSGPYDTWNIDYVYLNKGRSPSDLSFPDQAIASPLTSILPNQYRSIPYPHFLLNPTVTAPTYMVSNLRGNPPDVVYYFISGKFTNLFYGDQDTTRSVVTLSNFNSNPPPDDTDGINDDGSATILPFETKKVTVKHIEKIDTVNYLDPSADAVEIDLRVNLVTGDNINLKTGEPADDYEPRYIPIDFRVNDSLSSHYELKDYYAYDDGVAEYAGGLIESGNVFAYRFDIPETLPDTLRLLEAFDIYFPSYGLSSNQTADFFVFSEANGTPNEIMVRISSVSIREQPDKRFQRIRFLPPIELTQNSFFVGWRQPVAGDLLVGLDMSNDTADKMFYNTAGGINPDPARWLPNNLIHGSFMVRPVFGVGKADTFVGIEEDTKLEVFPNPNRGQFQITGKPEDVSVSSLTGQPVSFHQANFDETTYITVNVRPGLYIVRYRNQGILHTHKIVITQ